MRGYNAAMGSRGLPQRMLLLVLALALAGSPACREEAPEPSEGPTVDDGRAADPGGEEPSRSPLSSRPSRRGGRFLRQGSELLIRSGTHLARCFSRVSWQALRQRVESPAFLIARARAALVDGNATAARRYLHGALAMEPDNRDALRALAIALAADGRHEQAVGVYHKLLADDDAEPVSLFNLAVAYSRLGQPSLAEETYRRLLAHHRSHLRGWCNLAMILQAAGKLGEASEAWQQAVALSPSSAAAQAHYGEVLMDLHRPAEAVGAFTAAAHAEDDRVSHWANLALAARAAGQLGRSAAAYRRAVQLDRTDAAMWRRLGSALLDVHRLSGSPAPLAEAVSAWRESLAIQPDQPKVADWVRGYSAGARAGAVAGAGAAPATQPAP